MWGCGPCDLTAILAKLGYCMTGVDDLKDPWHLIGKNRERIKNFADKMGIRLINEPIESVELEGESFDAALLVDILEHSLNPRLLLNRVISAIKSQGLLLIETPCSVTLAKRILLLAGKSNYPNVDFIFYNVGAYRGHVREYNISELKRLLKISGLTEIDAKLVNNQTFSLYCESRGFRRFIIKFYDLISGLYPNFRDTIIIWARKPRGWRPIDDLEAIENMKSCYPHMVKYNLENEHNNIIVDKLKHFHEYPQSCCMRTIYSSNEET
jgi:SAM-dependent methyltransferase